jgi:hypothetical protein
MVVLRDAPGETSDQICALYFLELVVGRMLQQSGSWYWVVKWLWGGVKERRWNVKEALTYFQAATVAKVH